MRHRLVHNSTSSENFPCDKCNKSYSRKDVLLRHMRTAHLATKTRRQSTKSTTPRKSVTCAHCLQPALQCNGQKPCLPCRKHSALCRTNANNYMNPQSRSPADSKVIKSERQLSTSSSSSLPADEVANGFETEPSDISIFSAREDHEAQKTEEDESLIDPRLRGLDTAAIPTESVANHVSFSGEPTAQSPFDSSSQVHHDDWQYDDLPPHPFAPSETSWAPGNGYAHENSFDLYVPQAPDSDLEDLARREIAREPTW